MGRSGTAQSSRIGPDRQLQRHCERSEAISLHLRMRAWSRLLRRPVASSQWRLSYVTPADTACRSPACSARGRAAPRRLRQPG
jgi:hypothetical protein